MLYHPCSRCASAWRTLLLLMLLFSFLHPARAATLNCSESIVNDRIWRLLKHNSYFDGKVQSLGVDTDQGYATVGVISPGEYTFSTDHVEHITVITGNLDVELPGAARQTYTAGKTFIVSAKTSFNVACAADVSCPISAIISSTYHWASSRAAVCRYWT